MKYCYPFPKEVTIRPVQPAGEYAHANYPESKYAVDFLVEVGTPVLAARGGTVVKIKDDSDHYGVDPKLGAEANYVAVDHGDGTYSEYVHMGKGRIVAKLGAHIEVGALLGYTGLSGCMDVPHLHFNVFKVEEGRGVSIPFEFV